MSYTKIAKATPFAGLPKINLPSVYGASPSKPFFASHSRDGSTSHHIFC